MTDQILLSVPEAAARVGISRSFLYMRLADGSIDSVKAGKRRLIVLSSLNLWAANLPTSQLKQSTHQRKETDNGV
jgi:excisionase family DNA binding protein